MLEHLLEGDSLPAADIPLPPVPVRFAAMEFVSNADADPSVVLGGKAGTDAWLRSLGVDDTPEINPELQKALAAEAFGALTGSALTTDEKTRDRVTNLRTPMAVRHTIAMLTEYDWAFVDKAKEIRGYIVASLMDESRNSKPEIRLKALKMLGDVTEIGLFTQRVEVTTKSMTDEQVETEIRRRLERLTMNPDTPLVERVDTEVDDGS